MNECTKITYTINRPDVVCETIDNETIMINLKTGRYFSVSGMTAEVWTHLASGTTVSDLIVQMGETFDAPVETIATAINAFVEELCEQQLLRESVPAADRDAPSNFFVVESKRTFEPIRLLKFDDMEALLQVDPIHDVDETGWPKSV